jgi:hypothetical protein
MATVVAGGSAYQVTESVTTVNAAVAGAGPGQNVTLTAATGQAAVNLDNYEGNPITASKVIVPAATITAVY